MDNGISKQNLEEVAEEEAASGHQLVGVDYAEEGYGDEDCVQDQEDVVPR